MSVLKWAECHVTLANEGAFFFPVSPALALPAHKCYVETTSARGASYSWPTYQREEALTGAQVCFKGLLVTTLA